MARLQRGDRFQYQSVVDRYHLRPDYPPAIYDKLASFLDSESIVLDLGCGPGKLAYPLSQRARRVDAVDLSAAMIDEARRDPRDDSRIRWIGGDIHAVDLDSGYDLITAGASIHWMDWDRLFPRLAPRSSERGKVAFLEGDGARNPPWGAEELEVMKATQLAINDERPAWVDTARFPAPAKDALVKHAWFQRQGRLRETHVVEQPVDDYIEVSFSRQSFAIDAIGEAAAEQYRQDLRAVLQDHAVGALLTYEVSVFLEWGRLVQPD